jgi:hypothetical protein
MAAQDVSEQTIQDMTAMYDAQNEGIYDADWAVAIPAPTDFRTWFEEAIGTPADSPR